MENKFVIFYFILILVINESDTLKCGEEEIENCIECGKGEESNKCAKCKDKYFLFFHNLYCIACNDSTYGQVGCGGNCDSSRFSTDRFVYCNEDDCVDGFYNLNGICYRCADGSPGCKKCKYKEIVNENEEPFICEEYLNNQYRQYEQYGRCKHCSLSSPSYCTECHFDENKNNIC